MRILASEWMTYTKRTGWISQTFLVTEFEFIKRLEAMLAVFEEIQEVKILENGNQITEENLMALKKDNTIHVYVKKN